jgi:hypothetical protein
MSGGPVSPPPEIQFDDIKYGYDSNTAFCVDRQNLARFFPPNRICWNGVAIAIRELRCPINSYGSCGPIRAICVPASIECICPTIANVGGRQCVSLGPHVAAVVFESETIVSHIGPTAFSGCIPIRSICVPSSVQVLNSSCFWGCSSLSTVTFADGSQLSCIGDSVFSHCSTLSFICIPSSVQELFPSCFYECRSLSTVVFESDSKLSLICKGAFQNCASLISICVPSSVRTLGQSSFDGCKSLSTVTFECGSKLSRVERSTFSECPSLLSICVPPHLQSVLGDYLPLLKIAVPETTSQK